MGDIQLNVINYTSPDQLSKDGYFPLRQISAKYNYSKDHIGRLAKAGKIQGLRYGNKGDWYVKEDSLKEYFGSKIQEVKTPINIERVEEERRTGLFQALIIFVAGSLFLTMSVYPNLSATLTDNFNNPINLQGSLASEAKNIWSKITNLFSPQQKIIVRHIYEPSPPSTVSQGSRTETIREIVKEIQSLPSDTLASLNSRIDDLNLKFLTLSS